MRLIETTRQDGAVVFACECGHRIFTSGGQPKYQCDKCGRVLVIQGASVGEKSSTGGGGDTEDLDALPYAELKARAKAAGLKVFGVNRADLTGALQALAERDR